MRNAEIKVQNDAAKVREKVKTQREVFKSFVFDL